MQANDKSRVKILLIAALAIMLGLLVFTGSYAYKRYANVLTKVKNELKPSFILVNTERINGSLLEAESSLQNYYLTGEDSHLEQYFNAQKRIKRDLKILRNDPDEKDEILELTTQFSDNVLALLNLYEERYLSPEADRVEQTRSRLKDQLKRQEKVIEAIPDSIDVPKENLSGTEADEKATERKGFMDWLFGKKKQEEKEASTEEPVDSSFAEKVVLPNKADLLDSIQNKIEILGQQEALRFKELKARLLVLGKKEKSLKAANLDIRSKIEDWEKKKLADQTVYAELEIDNTNRWIGIIITLLIILVSFSAYVVYVNLERNKAYLKALNAAKLEAEDLASTKSRFLANMSHELRTPLNAILGFTEQLASDDLKDQQKEQLSYVNGAANHLLEVVNEVLDYTKVSSNTIRIKPVRFSLRPEMESVVKILNQLAAEKNLDLILDIDDKVPDCLKGDLFRIRQCLFNLLGNAIKFTENGSVSLKIEYVYQEESKVEIRFRVTDTGVGIKKENIKRVFKEFEQIDFESHKTKGTGLGLPITKRLIELMGGSIKMTSQPGEGTEISFKLWLQIADDTDFSTHFNGNITALKPLRALIADDEEYNIKLLGAILSKHQMVYETAINGDQALALAQQSKFDILLLDQRMPGKNGDQVVDELRNSNPDYKEIPVVFISADNTDPHPAHNNDNGTSFYMGKPFGEMELLRVLQRALNLEINDPQLALEESVDLQSLQNASGGDMQFVRDMLKTFKANALDTSKEMIANLEDSNYVKIGELAHRLAPSCKHLGFNGLYDELKLIENASVNLTWAPLDWKKHLAHVKHQVSHCINVIERQLEELVDEGA